MNREKIVFKNSFSQYLQPLKDLPFYPYLKVLFSKKKRVNTFDSLDKHLEVLLKPRMMMNDCRII